MVILIPIKIDHGKPITKVKVRTRIVIKMRTLVGSGYYNSKMKAIRRLQFYQFYLRDEVGLWKNKNTGKSGQQLMCNLNQVGREGMATFHLEI